MSKPRRRTSGTLPSAVVIGLYGYEIRTVPSGSIEDSVGEADCHAQIISLDESLSPEALKTTLVHELLHAMFDAYGTDELLTEIDEALVSLMEMPLLALLRSNPELVAYLTA